MPIPLAALAWPLVSTSLMTAGRFVVLRAVPAVTEFVATRALPAAVEAGKAIVTNAPSIASGTLSTAWKVGNVVATPIKHPVLTGAAAAVLHNVTDGKSTNLAIDGVGVAWNATKTHVPSLAGKIADGGLYVADGLTGMLETAGKRGIEHIGDHLPPVITPAPIRAAVAAAQAKIDQAKKAVTGTPSASTPTSQSQGESGDSNSDVSSDSDDVDTPESGAFRDMIGQQLGIDPKKINGKNITAAVGDFAKDHPWAIGLGALFGATASGGKMRKLMVGAVTTIGLVALAPFLAPIFAAMAPLLEGIKNFIKEKFDQSTLKGRFNTESSHIINRDRDPSATTPEPKLATSPTAVVPAANEYQVNLSDLTTRVSTKLADSNTSVDLRRPAVARQDSIYSLQA